MSGNGQLIGSRPSTRLTLQKRAAFRRTLAADERKKATILASREQKYRAGLLRAARICARRTTAAAIAQRHAMRKMWTRPQATWDFAASFDRGSPRLTSPENERRQS